MPKKNSPLAIVYDFDGTLAPGNMQERAFIPEIGVGKKEFWKEVEELSEKHQADNILMYMHLMLKEANHKDVKITKSSLKKFGNDIGFFKGILKSGDKIGWFDRINKYGKDSGVNVEHYIISSGLKEMIEGTKIANKFNAIFASAFQYDQHDVAIGPALSVTYTAKTQYLFRINKGILDVHNHTKINDFVEKNDRPIPFENMVFIGDGETDVPCFRLVKDQGGHSIAVYKPNTSKAKPNKLKKDGRVAYVAPADYQNSSTLDKIVKAIIEKVQIDEHLQSLR